LAPRSRSRAISIARWHGERSAIRNNRDLSRHNSSAHLAREPPLPALGAHAESVGCGEQRGLGNGGGLDERAGPWTVAELLVQEPLGRRTVGGRLLRSRRGVGTMALRDAVGEFVGGEFAPRDQPGMRDLFAPEWRAPPSPRRAASTSVLSTRSKPGVAAAAYLRRWPRSAVQRLPQA
jgi:hypothetical protein